MIQFTNVFRFVLLMVFAIGSIFGQATMTSTTLSAALTSTSTTFAVGSATGITVPGLPQSQGGIGSSDSNANTILYIDKEAMFVTGVSSTTITVRRAQQGTQARAHVSGAKVWVGPGAYYGTTDPSGSCTATQLLVLPRVVIPTGNVWNCPTDGANSGAWVKQATADGFEFTDGAVFLPASACVSSVSGNGSGTNGLTTSGASVTPVMQASTSASGTNTHTYVCDLSLVTRVTGGKGVQITDAIFYHGVQTTALGTQAATLASGTMNSAIVFSYIAFPTAGASETASTVTPVRADSGTLTITPVVASANTATTTAGAFYSIKFAPAAPIAVTTDARQLFLTVTLQAGATSATVTNTPGVLVHYRVSPL